MKALGSRCGPTVPARLFGRLLSGKPGAVHLALRGTKTRDPSARSQENELGSGIAINRLDKLSLADDFRLPRFRNSGPQRKTAAHQHLQFGSLLYGNLDAGNSVPCRDSILPICMVGLALICVTSIRCLFRAINDHRFWLDSIQFEPTPACEIRSCQRKRLSRADKYR